MAEELTIIVVALIGGDALDECVAAVRSQSANILAVRRDGMIVDADGRQVAQTERLDVPAKRRSAVETASAPLVALIEDTVVPASGWVDAVIAAFERKEVVACGGPVVIAESLPPRTRALAMSEYGAYNARNAAGEVSALPGCNFAFRRDALILAMRGADGLVDLEIFQRLKERGGKIAWEPEMVVTFARRYDQGARLTTRFDHGRIYASARPGFAARIRTVAKALPLPAVLTLRTLARATPTQRRSVRTLSWLILQHTAWAAGEVAGAILGPSRKGLGQWR